MEINTGKEKTRKKWNKDMQNPNAARLIEILFVDDRGLWKF